MLDTLPKKLYNFFLLFHTALRILLTPKFVNTEWITTAKKMLLYFVELCPELYGQKPCVYNIHNLTHLADVVLNLKVTLDQISCFPFENYLKKLKSLLRRPNRPCAQVSKRLSEKSVLQFTKMSIYYNVV